MLISFSRPICPARRNFLLILASIAILSLLLRLVVCFELQSLPSVRNPSSVTDMATYQRLAQEIARGDWPDHYDYQPFYYSLFLPWFYRIWGNQHATWAIMVAQALIGAAAVWLTGLAGARLYGRKAGIAAATLLGLSKFHVFYTPFLLLEVLSSFWAILLLVLALRSWRRNRWLDWSLTAAVAAAAVLTRGNALLLLPGVFLLAIWRNRRLPWRAVALTVAMIAIFQVPQLPFAWKNWRHTGRWCGASTAGDKVLALGNSPEAPPGGLEYPLTYHQWCALSDRHPDEGRISVPSQIWNWFRREPLLVAELKFKAFLLFWDRQEIANNVSIDLDGQASRLLSWPLLLPFALIGTLAVIGLLTTFSKSPPRLLLFYLLLASCLSTVLFYILARFRLSSLPFLCIAGGAAINYYWRMLPNLKNLSADLRRQTVLRHGLVLACAIFLVNAAFGFYQQYFEANFMRLFRPNGIVATTDEVVRVYDHGPLTIGGMTFLQVPQEGLILEKQLLLPTDLLASKAEHEAVIRMPIMAPKTNAWKGKLSCQGKTYPLTAENITNDRFLYWLEITVPDLKTQNEKMLHLTVELIPGSDNLGFGVDLLRQYRRSKFQNRKTGSPLPIDGEIAMEVDLRL